MICPYMFYKETKTNKEGITVTTEKHENCCKENCPFYSWKDWNKAGQGCLKARNEIEAEKRSIGY